MNFFLNKKKTGFSQSAKHIALSGGGWRQVIADLEFRIADCGFFNRQWALRGQ